METLIEAASARRSGRVRPALRAVHGRAVYNYCFRRTADWSVAEDPPGLPRGVAQAERSSDPRRHAAALAHGVATNVLRNRSRSLRRYLPVPRSAAERRSTFARRGGELDRRRADAPRPGRSPVSATGARPGRWRSVVLGRSSATEEAAAALDLARGTAASRCARRFQPETSPETSSVGEAFAE